MRAPPRMLALATLAAAAAADDSCVTRTLTSDCAQPCASRSALACVLVDTTGSAAACADIEPLGFCPVADYGCRAACYLAPAAKASEFAFFVPFGDWESEQERQLRRNATVWWQRQVDALPASNTTAPHLRNDYLVAIGALDLPPRYRSINIAGGYSSILGVKGKVANVSVMSGAFANATNVTSVSLAHLNIGDMTLSIASLMPKKLEQLRLVNCLLDTVPSDLPQLTSLQSLNLSMNFLASVSLTGSLPALQSLDLSRNNLTSFDAADLRNLETLSLQENFLDAIPSSVYALSSLKTLRMAQNPLALGALTPSQYQFLSQLPTLEIDAFRQAVDCTKGEKKTLGDNAITVCVTSETPVALESSDKGSNTVLICAIVGGVFVALLVASFVWKKLRGPSVPKNPTTTSGVEFAKHESEGSDSSGGDFVACGSSDVKTNLTVAKPTPVHSTTTSATHSVASSPAETMGLLHRSNSTDGVLFSHQSSFSGGFVSSNGSSNRSHGDHSSPMTRTIVISRPMERSNLSGLTLWDDGELNAYLLKYEDIEDVRLIGSGGHGVVWLVNYRQTRQLASKRLVRDQLTRQKTFDFVAEIKLVAQLHHPSIVEFVGVAWTVESDLQALFEYMSNGDLRTYLEHTAPDGVAGRKRTVGSAKDEPDADEGAAPVVLSWIHDKWQLALSISEALVYVHSFLPPLVHRDLKSRNVLLSADMKAKLSDFGVSRFTSENGTMSTNVGTGKWIAPEVIAGSKSYDSSCDIYAFGVLLSELDTHKLPYDDVVGDHGERLPEIALMQRIAANQLKPTFSPACPRDIVELALRCLSFEPAERPTAVNVAFDLRTFARKHGFFDIEQL